MNFVQPIRDPEKIAAMKKYLLQRSKRNYILFVLGINTGLRISDLTAIEEGGLVTDTLETAGEEDEEGKEDPNSAGHTK